LPDDATPDIETLDSREVYRNRWMRVREDRIRRRDGSEGIFGVVEKPNFAVIAPLDGEGRLHLVEQFRYPVGRRFREFPQGAWETRPDADPLDLARGELREETGFLAGRMVHVGGLFQGYGYSTQKGDVYLATDLKPGPPAREADEQDMTCAAYAVAEVEAMILKGEILDAMTISAFGLLRLRGLL